MPAPTKPRLALAAICLATAALAAQFTEPTRILHTFAGDLGGGLFGWVSAPVADLDGDGAGEVAVTAPFRASRAGRVQVFSGRTGAERFRLDGATPGSRLGFAVRDVGDLDGDGRHDLAVGAPGSPTVAGEVVLVSGRTGAALRRVQLGKTDDAFGFSVAPAGDVDRDGVPDVAAAAVDDDTAGANAGRVYVFSGKTGTVLRTLTGARAGDRFGSALGGLADVTGDGRPELIVGVRDAGATRGGEVLVYDLTSPAAPLHRLVPDSTAVDFGLFFAADVGDVDKSGWPDVYVGDFADSAGGPAAGKAYVFDGRTGGRIWTIPGTSAGAGFGIGRGAGDVNGDGHADLLLCAWQDSTAAARAGKAWLYSGADLRVLRTYTHTLAGGTFGYDAHGVGDVDGDGRLDLFVTAAEANGSRGLAYLISGCDATAASYGSGVPGSGAFVPELALAGCASPGLSPSIEVRKGLGGAPGVALLSAQRASTPYLGGQLLVGPGVAWNHALGGARGVPGAGLASLRLAIPNLAQLRGQALHVQAGYADRGAPFGVSLSAGLTVTIR